MTIAEMIHKLTTPGDQKSAMTPDKILYTAEATSTGGRNGKVRTSDGALEVSVAMPMSMGGEGADGTNPEQLFALAYAACFGSAVAHVARLQKVNAGPVEVTARVGIGSTPSGFGLTVGLIAHLPDLPKDQAQTLVEAADRVCPYSNAIRGNIPVTIEVR